MEIEMIIKDLDRIISIPSVLNENEEGYLYGKDIQRALEEILSIGKELDFHVRNVDNQVGIIEFGQGNETLGILTHIDVVPAGEGWTKPPFKLTVEDGKLFGRGVLDDKGPIIGILHVLKKLKAEGFSPAKKIQLIIGTDEENMWRGMNYYKKNFDLPDLSFSPDGSFPMISAEKGILDIDLKVILKENTIFNNVTLKSFKGGMSRNSVCDKAEITFVGHHETLSELKYRIEKIDRKTTDDLKIIGKELYWSSTGVIAHGMQPEKGLNAAMTIVDTLSQLSDNSNIKLLNNLVGSDYYGSKAGIAYEDDISGKTTFNVGMIDYTNEVLILKNSLRYSVTLNSVDYELLIKKQLNDLNVEVVDHLKPLYVNKDSELMKVLSEVYTNITGQVSEPISIGGGTYARMLPNAVSFGPCFPDQHECAHEPDEYFDINRFLKMMDIYYAAIVKLTE